jgi:hypothetical protein
LNGIWLDINAARYSFSRQMRPKQSQKNRLKTSPARSIRTTMKHKVQGTSEKRIRRRCLTSALVEVSTDTEKYVGVLEDMSKLGACIHLEHPLPVDEKIKLHTNGLELGGVVRFCKSYDGDDYRVGIELAGTEGWPEALQWPIHSLE